MPFQFTSLNAQVPSAKSFSYENSQLIKRQATSAHHTPYFANVLSFETLSGFRDHLAKMQPDSVNLYGVPTVDLGSEEFMIVPKSQVESAASELDTTDKHRVISRTKDNFIFPASKPGIFMVDIDDSSDIENDINTILKEIPQLADAQYIRQYSSSSNIFFNGTMVNKPSGMHLYWMFDDASAIPSVAKIIFDRLVLAGYGSIKLAANGAMLARSKIDISVYQPERIDFAGGANLLTEGMTQERDPQLCHQHLPTTVATKAFKALSAKETKQVKVIWEELKEKAEPESAAKSEAWIKSARNNAEKEARKTAVRCIQRNSNTFIIQPGFTLTTNGEDYFDIQEVIDAVREDAQAASDKYNEMSILDPETEEKGKTKLYVNASKLAINIHSFAQGGKKYRVTYCPSIEKSRIEQDTDTIINILAKSGRFFAMGGSMVHVTDKGEVTHFTSENKSTNQFIYTVSGKYFDYTSKGKDALTMDVAKFILDNAGSNLPEIERVSAIPAINEKYEIYGTKAGYHKMSKTYFLNDTQVQQRKISSKEQAQGAVEYLLKPFSAYTFAHGSKSRAAMLATVMTCAIRPILRTAPGVMVWTPRGGQSTGKSAMTEALVQITGMATNSFSWSSSKAETEKRVVAHMLAGANKVLRIENIGETLTFDSDALSNVLTEPVFTGRILGASQASTFPTNYPVICSCNNYNPSKDIAVRMLDIELEPVPANPGWLPVDKVDRQRFLETAFALIEYVSRNHDMSKLNKDLPSLKFDHWSKLVQYPVFLLTGHDPMERSNLIGKMADADDMFEITSVLEHAHTHFGSDLIDQPAKAFKTCDTLANVLMATANKTTFERAFSALAKELGREYRYENFILKRTGDRATNNKQNTFTLINTKPALSSQATVVNFADYKATDAKSDKLRQIA